MSPTLQGGYLTVRSPGKSQIMFMLSHSVVTNSEIPWTVALQAPLSMGFPRQEYWGGLLFPSPVDLPDLGPIGELLMVDEWVLNERHYLPHLINDKTAFQRFWEIYPKLDNCGVVSLIFKLMGISMRNWSPVFSLYHWIARLHINKWQKMRFTNTCRLNLE